jgi:hypothetical protein
MICDDRVAVRNWIRITGKSLLPRLDVSATIFAPYVRPHRGCPGIEPGPGRGTVRPKQRCRPAAGRSGLAPIARLFTHEAYGPSVLCARLTARSQGDNNHLLMRIIQSISTVIRDVSEEKCKREVDRSTITRSGSGGLSCTGLRNMTVEKDPLFGLDLASSWHGCRSACSRSDLNPNLLCVRLLRSELSAIVLRKEPIAAQQFR